MFAIYRKDIDEFGGIGISDEIFDVIRDHATHKHKERQLVIAWINEALFQVESDWNKKEYTQFQKDLKR